MTERTGPWVRIVVINVAATVLIVLAFSGADWHTPWRRLVEWASVSLLFSSCCTVFVSLTMMHLVPFVSRRLRFPMNWIAIVAALVGSALGGSLLALSLLVATGYIERAQFVPWFAASLKVSVIVTLLFGIFSAVLKMLRIRLDETTVALRTKERDEERARTLAIEAQLASLEARVNPHFLFNTLNSIAELVHDDPAAAERVTGQLASLLRSSLDGASTPLVPLAQELGMVRSYLEIERVRFGDRLRYTFSVPDRLATMPVPRLALQTLVENSVKYAVSPRREGASILVRAVEAEGRVRLDVEDDGPGFDAAYAPEGHGLALVRSRLAMIYDGRSSMRVTSAAGRTCVTLDLPGLL